MRVLVFGDSITQGFWDIEGGWVDRLRKYYDSQQILDLEGKAEPTIFNLGISADNSQNVLDRIEQEVNARTRFTPDIKPIVIIQIGANDSCVHNGEPQIAIDQYRENLRAIYNKVKVLTSKIIFIGLSACDESKTTPVFWGEYCYTNKAIKMYEDCMSEAAKELKLDFISIFERFKAELDNGNNLLPDGLHPNDQGHKLIYEIVKPKLLELLR